MADYLLPDSKLSITQKRRLFSIRNKMLEIPENYSSDIVQTFCFCGEREVISHIYYCNILKNNNDDGSISD